LHKTAPTSDARATRETREMSCLSVIRDGRSVVVANPIYLLSPIEVRNGANVTFEVLAADAASLKDLVGQISYYYLDPPGFFWAQLKTLDECQSTHPGLALLRNKPAFRGVFSIFGDG
jgi:hypothetical protein